MNKLFYLKTYKIFYNFWKSGKYYTKAFSFPVQINKEWKT